MSAGTGVESNRRAQYGGSVPWVDVGLAAIAAVSWALIGMAGTAALGLHLLGADTAGSLGPMTAAVVALGAGGSVTPSGDVSAFGLTGAEANTAIEITPLGVSLVGALLLSWFFLRSLRAAGVVIAPAELLARAGAVVVLFVAMLGGLAWAGHDVITLDGGSLGLDDLPGVGGGGSGGGGGLEIPGLGDVGDIGGLLPDRLGDLVDAKAAVGFTVDTAPTLLGGLLWSAGILLIALLASRRTPLPRGWDAVHRVVRPAVSAVVTVLLVAVAAGFAAAAYAAIGDEHPRRIAGAALLGAPNGVWLGVSIGLFVPWDGRATGALTNLLPDPLDNLLRVGTDQSVTLGRLAELEGRVWLLGVATAVMMLFAGVLVGVRTPVGVASAVGAGAGGGAGAGRGLGEVGGAAGGASGSGGPSRTGGAGTGAGGAARTGDWAARGGRESGLGSGRGAGVWGFVGRCAVRLGVVTALALPLLGSLTGLSVDASLSVLGFDAFGAGVELHAHLGMALLLGAAWGAGAGAAGALLAYATGAAGRRAAPLALGDVTAGAGGRPEYVGEGGRARYTAGAEGPYAPSASYRAPNPATNPYLQVPEELREPQDARPDEGPGRTGRPGRYESGGPGGPAPGAGQGGGGQARPYGSGSGRPGGGQGRGGAGQPWPYGNKRPGETPAGEGRGGGPYPSRPPYGGGRDGGVSPGEGQGRGGVGQGLPYGGGAGEAGRPSEEGRGVGEPGRPAGEGRGAGGWGRASGEGRGDVYGAETVVGPVGPGPQRPGGTSGDDGPPPPPPPPPPLPPKRPKRPR
ncbi:streptophobe family protein [Streptomyces sp. NPDC096132]|uniref:streptophobe family protein n=1 Tax=Streptomyces sp. NPDC096132 TaxID=3366075 RepID=UPI003818BB3C